MVIRRAASLIELMVAIAIIGLLMALLLPSVQSARESSRANTCRNNLRQVGVGLLNFESAHKHFPAGASAICDRNIASKFSYGLSWWADAVGFMEETLVADQLDRTGNNIGWVVLNAHNGSLADGFAPPSWFCPSSSVDRFTKVAQYRIAVPSYTGIAGATNHDGFHEDRVNILFTDGQISAGGVLIPNAKISIRQVSDGLSKTLLVGEQSEFAYTSSGARREIGAAFSLGWVAGTNVPGTPRNYTDPSAPAYNLSTLRYRLNERRYNLPGVSFDGGPNNPLSSPHAGVVHLLYCDGSVHVVDDSLAIGILKALATRDDGFASTQ